MLGSIQQGYPVGRTISLSACGSALTQNNPFQAVEVCVFDAYRW